MKIYICKQSFSYIGELVVVMLRDLVPNTRENSAKLLEAITHGQVGICEGVRVSSVDGCNCCSALKEINKQDELYPWKPGGIFVILLMTWNGIAMLSHLIYLSGFNPRKGLVWCSLNHDFWINLGQLQPLVKP